MRYIIMFFVFFLLATYVHAPPAAAETRYVVDELIITLRIGKSTDHKILKSLTTGTPLEVLDDADETYTKVRTTDGIEGYVLRQYISADIPKKQRIKELETLTGTLQKKIGDLQEAKNSLEIQLKTIREDYQQNLSNISAKSEDQAQHLEGALNNERAMAEKYNTLLEQAGNVVEIAAERDQLQQINKKMETEVTALREKNDKLAESRMIKWFLAGGGVFLFGWIIGKISRKKRSRL
jgi:SH3 domain protein